MINGTGAYDAQGPFLRTRGYYVHPIMPQTKIPGYYVPSEKAYRPMENWNHPARPMEKSPQPGAGIGLRCGLQADGKTYIIAVDYDDDAIALAATDDPKLYGDVRKEGQRGFTAFFKSSKPVPSRDFKIGDRMVVQILSDGKQTVIPGSVHPDTGKPYAWGDDSRTLYQCNPCDVTDVAEDLVERIEALIAPLGYEPPPDKPEASGTDAHDDGDQFQTLNNAALHRLEDWVPDLGLYGLKRPSGRYASYRAVCSFRPSLSGKEMNDRNQHLSIRRGGIRDFGENKGYSPIQLAMVCLSLPFGEAVDWLRERVLPKGPDVDYDTIVNNAEQRPKEDDRTGDKAGDDTPGPKPRKLRFKLTPYREMKPGLDQNYLVDELFPARGLVVVWSPPKNFKSFVMLSVGLHVAMGWKYCGRAVQQGLVLYCAFEGGHMFSNRIEAQRLHYGLADEDVPMPVLKGMANLISDHKLMIDEFKYQLQGTRPVAVILDTLNRSFVGSESKDADMANYVRAAEAIRDAFDCVVIIVHHTGWDESRMRGHSSLPAAVDAELSITREGDMATLEVKLMRDGVEGTQVLLKSKTVDIGPDSNGKEQTSLVLIPADAEDVMPSAGRPKGQQWPRSLKTFQRAVSESMSGAGFDFESAGRPVRAVEIRYVRDKFFRSYLADNDEAKRQAWKRALDTAQQKHLISAQSGGKREIIWFTAQEQVDDGYAF